MDMNQCTYCSKPSEEFYCSRCNDYYCSQTCQKLDWPRHRYICLQMPKLLAKVKTIAIDESVTKTEEPTLTEPTHKQKVPNNVVIVTEDIQIKPPLPKPELVQKPPASDTKNHNVPEFVGIRKPLLQQKMPNRENFNFTDDKTIKSMQNDRNNNSTNFSGRMEIGQPAYARSFPRPKLDVPNKVIEKPKEIKPIYDTKWKTFKPILTNFGDYFEVIVRHVDRTGTTILLYVTLTQYEKELKEFGEEIAKSHKSKDSIKRNNFDDIGVGSLVIVSHGDSLQRAEVLKINYGPPELKVKLIDYGGELHIKDMSTVKMPNDFAYAKEKFCVAVETKSLSKYVEVGDRIEIKVNAQEMSKNGFISVEVKEPAKILKDAENKSKQMEKVSGLAHKHLGAMKSRVEPVALFSKDIDYVQLPTNKPFSATIMDGTFLMEHRIVTIAEDNDECKQFYNVIQDCINKHIASLKPVNDSYTPKIDELVLAKFEGEFYRGFCMDIKDGEYEILYVDYGNFGNVRKEEMRKFPVDLLFPVRAHTCCIKNFDPEKLSDKMVTMLESGKMLVESVEANEMSGNFVITIGYTD